MSAGPKDKSAPAPVDSDGISPRDAVSLVVALTLVALGAGGLLAVFSGPLSALLAH
jgi:hypothetical protein